MASNIYIFAAVSIAAFLVLTFNFVDLPQHLVAPATAAPALPPQSHQFERSTRL
jgi:hypothetical protein